MAAPLNVTPDIIAPSMNGLRAFSGISATCCVVTTPPRLALWVSSIAASAVTSTRLGDRADFERDVDAGHFGRFEGQFVADELLEALGRRRQFIFAGTEERNRVGAGIVGSGRRDFVGCYIGRLNFAFGTAAPLESKT